MVTGLSRTVAERQDQVFRGVGDLVLPVGAVGPGTTDQHPALPPAHTVPDQVPVPVSQPGSLMRCPGLIR